MRIAVFVALLGLGLVGCASTVPTVPREVSGKRAAGLTDLNQLQIELGMDRRANDLGFSEKNFDSCSLRTRSEDGECGARHFSVVYFRLQCRDTEETTSAVATNFRPVVSDRVQWKLGTLIGFTRTDSAGYGQIKVMRPESARGQRLVLIVGKQFLGLDVSEVSQIIVPNYWCTQK